MSLVEIPSGRNQDTTFSYMVFCLYIICLIKSFLYTPFSDIPFLFLLLFNSSHGSPPPAAYSAARGRRRRTSAGGAQRAGSRSKCQEAEEEVLVADGYSCLWRGGFGVWYLLRRKTPVFCHFGFGVLNGKMSKLYVFIRELKKIVLF